MGTIEDLAEDEKSDSDEEPEVAHIRPSKKGLKISDVRCQLELDNGSKIRYYHRPHDESVIELHCSNPLHNEGEACVRTMRMTASATDARPGMGRPLGYAVAWLSNCEQLSKAEHLDFHPDFFERHIARVSARADYSALWEELQSYERPLRDGEDSEPEEL